MLYKLYNLYYSSRRTVYELQSVTVLEYMSINCRSLGSADRLRLISYASNYPEIVSNTRADHPSLSRTVSMTMSIDCACQSAYITS
jgi:hypothetical protein